jgi:hypothetical protein
LLSNLEKAMATWKRLTEVGGNKIDVNNGLGCVHTENFGFSD